MYTRAGGSRTPPIPTQPISSPTSRAETSIEASASVTRLTSPHTTRAKPCEHVGEALLYTGLPVRRVLGTWGKHEGMKEGTGAVQPRLLEHFIGFQLFALGS